VGSTATADQIWKLGTLHHRCGPERAGTLHHRIEERHVSFSRGDGGRVSDLPALSPSRRCSTSRRAGGNATGAAAIQQAPQAGGRQGGGSDLPSAQDLEKMATRAAPATEGDGRRPVLRGDGMARWSTARAKSARPRWRRRSGRARGRQQEISKAKLHANAYSTDGMRVDSAGSTRSRSGHSLWGVAEPNPFRCRLPRAAEMDINADQRQDS